MSNRKEFIGGMFVLLVIVGFLIFQIVCDARGQDVLYGLNYSEESGIFTTISRMQRAILICDAVEMENKTILDIGAGDCWFGALMEEWKNCEATCYDIIYKDSRILGELRDRHPDLRIVDSLDDLGVEFDVVLLMDVIEHIYYCQLLEIIATISPYCHEETRFVFYTSVRTNLFWLFGKKQAGDYPGHVNPTTTFELRWFMEDLGMREIYRKIFITGRMKEWVSWFPYPFNELWGGHFLQVFEHEKN